MQGILDKEKIFCDTLRFLFSQHSVIPEEIKNTTKIFFFFMKLTHNVINLIENAWFWPFSWNWLFTTAQSKNSAVQFSSVQFSHSVVSDSVTLWTVASQASLSITKSRSLLKLMSIELVMSSNHLILCRPLLLPPSIFPSSVLHERINEVCSLYICKWSN